MCNLNMQGFLRSLDIDGEAVWNDFVLSPEKYANDLDKFIDVSAKHAADVHGQARSLRAFLMVF